MLPLLWWRAAVYPPQVLIQHKLTSIDIRRKDILCMAGNGWLNDEVINVYMGLLQVPHPPMHVHGCVCLPVHVLPH